MAVISLREDYDVMQIYSLALMKKKCEVPCATLEVTTPVLLRVPAFGKVTEWLPGLQRSGVPS